MTMRRLLAATALFAAVFLAGFPALAAKEDRAAQFYEDAIVRLDKDDLAGAIIQLKNALQQDPRMLSAHLMLGQAYLRNQQPDAAQESLEAASRLGADRSQLALPMARALIAQNKIDELIDRFPPEVAQMADRTELMILRGEAFRRRGNPTAAQQMFEAVLQADPRGVPGLLALADFLIKQNKPQDAARYVDQALALAPTDATAWFVRASVFHATGDTRKALEAYGKALSFSPVHVDARVARIGLLLDLGRDAEALTDLDYLKRENPREPRAAYFRAIYLTRKGDGAGVRESLAQVTELLDPVPIEVVQSRAPELLMIGALAAHGLDQQEKAMRYLEHFLMLDPRNVGARKLLGSILVTRREFARAIEVLEGGRRSDQIDPQLLALLATGYMAVGKNQLASRLLDQALTADSSSPSINATLGYSLLQNGQQDLAIQFLQKAFDKDPLQGNVGTALATLYARRGDSKKALAVAEQVAKRQPTNPAVLNLLGVVRAATGDQKGGRLAYEKAIAQDANFSAPQLNLGKLDLAEGNLDAARSRFSRMLQVNSKDAQALYELAKVELAANRPDEALRALDKLRNVNSRDIPGALLMVDVYLGMRQPRKALEVAQSVQPLAPENPEVLGAVARSFIALQDSPAAQAVLTRMIRVAGTDAGWLYAIATLQMQAGDRKGAERSLERALEAKPGYINALALQIELDLQEGRFDQAESRARAVGKDKAGGADSARLLGDVALSRGRPAEAIEQYKLALSRDPSSVHLLRLFNAYMKAGEPQKGVAILEGWTRERPRDLLAQRALAEGYLRVGKLEAAKARYELVLRGGPDAGILNNLAVIEDRLGSGAKGIEHAEAARRLAPNDSGILDTLGWLLVRNGSIEVGLKHLREAKLRSPSNPEIRYHYAAALIRSGRIAEGKRELTQLLKENNSFESFKEAEALLRTSERG